MGNFLRKLIDKKHEMILHGNTSPSDFEKYNNSNYNNSHENELKGHHPNSLKKVGKAITFIKKISNDAYFTNQS